jgi:hypothetical protein
MVNFNSISAVPHFILATPRPDQGICQKSASDCLKEAKNNTKTPKQIFTELFQKADFVFVGENHFAEDEIILTELVNHLKRIGVKQIAVEMPAEHKDAIASYFDEDINPAQQTKMQMRRGERNLYEILDMAENFVVPELYKFYRAAHKAGIKIVPVDGDSKKSEQERDQFISYELQKLEGKTLVLLGSFHVTKTSAYSNAADLLKSTGRKVVTVHLESTAATKAISRTRENDQMDTPKYFRAYQEWTEKFGPPSTPLGIYTKQFGPLHQLDPLSGKNYPYHKNSDAVILLPPDKSPLTPAGKQVLNRE